MIATVEKLPAKTVRIGKYTLPVHADVVEDPNVEVHDVSLEPIEFYFDYLRFKFKCTCFNMVPDTPPVFTLTSNLCAIPVAAESSHARYAVLKVVKEANLFLNGAVRLVDGDVAFAAFHPVESPVTSTILVTAIAKALAPAKPYLQLLADVGGNVEH